MFLLRKNIYTKTAKTSLSWMASFSWSPGQLKKSPKDQLKPAEFAVSIPEGENQILEDSESHITKKMSLEKKMSCHVNKLCLDEFILYEY